MCLLLHVPLGGEWTCGISVATAEKPEGPFIDHGMMFRSSDILVFKTLLILFIIRKWKEVLVLG